MKKGGRDEMKIEATNRGFAQARFTDRNGVKCSIQKSSLATESCLWLGADDIGLIKFDGSGGWKAVELEGPAKYQANTRMHLTQANVAALLPLLKHFALTGELPTSEPQLVDAETGPEPQSPIYAEGDAKVERIGEIRLEDGDVFLGAILTFPAGPPDFTWSVVWQGTPMTLAVKEPN